METTKYSSKVEKNSKIKSSLTSSDINTSLPSFVNSICTSSAKSENSPKKKITCISKMTTSKEATCKFFLILVKTSLKSKETTKKAKQHKKSKHHPNHIKMIKSVLCMNFQNKTLFLVIIKVKSKNLSWKSKKYFQKSSKNILMLPPNLPVPN